MIILFVKHGEHMATESEPPAGLGTELASTEIVAGPVAEGEAEQSEHKVGDEEIYDAIRRLRVMSLGLGMAAARTRDGIYTAWAYNATATAGILRTILEERDSPFVDVLQNEEATEEENEGSRQVF